MQGAQLLAGMEADKVLLNSHNHDLRGAAGMLADAGQWQLESVGDAEGRAAAARRLLGQSVSNLQGQLADTQDQLSIAQLLLDDTQSQGTAANVEYKSKVLLLRRLQRQHEALESALEDMSSKNGVLAYDTHLLEGTASELRDKLSAVNSSKVGRAADQTWCMQHNRW
jgi:chromosome segregation ATPase